MDDLRTDRERAIELIRDEMAIRNRPDISAIGEHFCGLLEAGHEIAGAVLDAYKGTDIEAAVQTGDFSEQMSKFANFQGTGMLKKMFEAMAGFARANRRQCMTDEEAWEICCKEIGVDYQQTREAPKPKPAPSADLHPASIWGSVDDLFGLLGR